MAMNQRFHENNIQLRDTELKYYTAYAQSERFPFELQL